jgi:predicted GTPase
MSDLVENVRALVSSMHTATELLSVSKVVDTQIEMTVENLRDITDKHQKAQTDQAREQFARQVEARRLDVRELQEVKALVVRRLHQANS